MEQTRLVDGTKVVGGADAEENEVGGMETAIVGELGVGNMGVTVEIGESSVLEIGESSGLQIGESSVSPHPAAAPPGLPP